MSNFKIDAVVVGAGVVGLACARALAHQGREVVILEAQGAFGSVTSARNSEVIHSGLYYPTDSLKARSCVEGARLLYVYLAERGLPFRRCGKLVVATSAAEIDALERIFARARANGVADAELLTGSDARALEPALQAEAALNSPSTGILDSHAYMLSLLGDAEAAGAELVLRSPVVAGRVGTSGVSLDVGGPEPYTLTAEVAVNAAGLEAPAIAAKLEGLAPAHVPGSVFCKGNYFTLSGRSAFSRLIYPVPEPGGLGIHLTLDLGGRARFGPDTQWLAEDGTEALDYQVDASRAQRFYGSIRRYWPALADGSLEPAYCGIRPKLRLADGALAEDFVVSGPAEHGVQGLVNLFGIESPGLTASLSLARHVARLV